MRALAVTGLLLSLAIEPVNAAGNDDRNFFETRVRPLLIKHCLACHGSKKQESGLRLDTRAGWARGGELGPALVPGKPLDSRLIQAVTYSDPSLKMPPRGKLSPTEIADLTRWIQRGAFDPRNLTPDTATAKRMTLKQARSFWAFRPLTAPRVPKTPDTTSIQTPVDAFVWDRLHHHGLSAVAPADKRTLIRRATFDLTGLPPTPSEIKTFLDDNSPQALPRVVDRLLDSPAYGERWGRHWLDVARYADTAGDGSDYPVREAYKYRDWVIDAFNRDMPFDEFLREQIAGDILARQRADNVPERYASQVTATGFLAIGKRYGYKASPDYQYLDFADVIDSVGRSLLGLSLGCARCHDHKYDPISAADYYALYGILQSTTWAFPGGEEQKRPAHFPSLVPPTLTAKLEKLKAEELARLDTQLSVLKRRQMEFAPNWRAGGFDLGFEAQKPNKRPASPWVCAGPIEITSEAQSPFQTIHPKGTLGVRIGSGKPTDGLRYVFKDGLRATPGRHMHFTVDFRSLESPGKSGAFRFYLGRGVVQSLAIQCSATATEFAIRNGNKWETLRRITPGTWYTLRISIDPAKKTFSGVVGAPDDLTTFANKAVGPGWDGIADCFICDATGHVAGPACSRDLDNIGLQDEAFAPPDGLPVKPRLATPRDKTLAAAATKEIEALEQKRRTRAERPAYEVAYGVSEGTPVNAHIQQRGEPGRPGREIPRRFLEVLGGDRLSKPAAGSGRLELAHWITRRKNPLTARVFVNRVWLWHFGTGLVSTPSDFGSRGQPPTHPRLLDWLAVQFIDSGWSVKALHRLVMNSRTYQLASGDNDRNLQVDPDNRWHWRFTRRPLDAESIRDAMLALSGQLNRDIPQAHPFPPVNTWGFSIHHPFHAVYNSNHRSVYLMVQRNRRHPYLALFDAADPNQSVASRQPTTTPTQALYLMNSPFVHARARGFAERLLAAPRDTRTRVRVAFEMAHGRLPREREAETAIAFVAGYQKKLASQQPAVNHELTAWSALARVLLTSNAFLYVD